MQTQNAIVPILKWVGGKRQLLPTIHEMLPDKISTYYEPFFGGGALFFSLLPEKAVLNDFNPQLIGMYRAIQQNPLSVEAELLDIQGTYNALPSDMEKANYYGYLRRLFNVKIQKQHHDAQMAALLIFLNKAGFNGLYSVNKSSEYNVPSAHKKTIHSFTHDNLLSVSSALQNATILCGDFEAAVQTASPGDFIFFDFPYYNTFDTYQSNGFSEADHRRLANLFQALTDKGVSCMLTNSNTDFILSLYKGFHIRTVQVKRLVNSDASKRTGEEIIVTNYATGGEFH